MTDRPTTLKQVAIVAGVSLSTASRALSGKAKEFRISAKTERVILRTAKKLGFQASHVAQSLRARRTGTIGLLVPDASNPFFAGIAREVTRFAELRDMSTVLADSRGSLAHESKLLLRLRSRRVDGLIVCPVGSASAHWRQLTRGNKNVVVVDRWFSDLKFPTVTSDNELGAYAATVAMIDQGHRHIGCVQGRPTTSVNEERLKVYCHAFETHGIAIRKSLIRGNDFCEESGYLSTCELLKRRPQDTAIFAFSNQNALGALRAIRQRELRIPDDISMIMFDDAPFASTLRPQ
jgi:LacI family transcriptional regulator